MGGVTATVPPCATAACVDAARFRSSDGVSALTWLELGLGLAGLRFRLGLGLGLGLGLAHQRRGGERPAVRHVLGGVVGRQLVRVRGRIRGRGRARGIRIRVVRGESSG